MRRDEPIPPFATEDPVDGIDVSAYWFRYCIGEDTKPDEIVELRANGAFHTDSRIKAEITELPVPPDDIYVRAARIPGQGLAAYAISTWLQPAAVGVLGAMAYNKIQSLKHQYGRPVTRTQYNAAEFDADQIRAATPLAQQQLQTEARTFISGHFSVQGNLTVLGVDIQDLRSETAYSGPSSFAMTGDRASLSSSTAKSGTATAGGQRG
ncbi:hypothetical protein [[Mycobacterium] crassicus]|uniref:Uncharacterized protein n=1 Tax=[Mycobacterium] crassicus TaxID=2872309 RepID=A0ABU5XPD0_9MYCO|nr:hypothetical protein [Mycolicibacter sp. MYC098]MEB3024064.1 hypothetical protein [Mycolicibacter sp. MYC098]